MVGWLLATAAALSIVYSPYSENKDGGEPWTNVQRAFYEGFGRPAWGLCVAWVIFACHTGCGGKFCSEKSWTCSVLSPECFGRNGVARYKENVIKKKLQLQTTWNHAYVGIRLKSVSGSFLFTSFYIHYSSTRKLLALTSDTIPGFGHSVGWRKLWAVQMVVLQVWTYFYYRACFCCTCILVLGFMDSL